VTRYS